MTYISTGQIFLIWQIYLQFQNQLHAGSLNLGFFFFKYLINRIRIKGRVVAQLLQSPQIFCNKICYHKTQPESQILSYPVRIREPVVQQHLGDL